jgi:hypothetical protein
MVLEGIFDRVPVERHVAVQAGVSLLQVEVLLDRAGERRGILAGRVVEREGLLGDAGFDCHRVSVASFGRVAGHAAV